MQSKEQLLWELSQVNYDGLDSVADKIASELHNRDFFCLWLVGDIGAGKTTLTGYILKKLGLSSKVPVTSPTFTYLSDYKIDSKTYAHLDFYRLTSSGRPLSDLLSYFDYDGLFIEWPENLNSDLELIRPTNILRIEKGEDLKTRDYKLFSVS